MQMQTIWNELDFPLWIEHLLYGLWFSCSETGYVHIRQKMLRQDVLRAIDAHENGYDELQKACYICLKYENKIVVEKALACLFVIGSVVDVEFINPLLEHPEESVRKAARTCIFEIKNRVVEE